MFFVVSEALVVGKIFKTKPIIKPKKYSQEEQ